MSVVERAFCRSAPWRSFTRRVALPWLLQGRTLQGRVLEVGCGPGANAEAMAQRFPSIQLTATDIDPTMVTAARHRLASHHDVLVEEADIAALPFDDGSMDAVVALLMLHHVIEWEAGVASCARVLRPGGLLVGYDLLDSRLSRLIHRLDRSAHRMLAVAELESVLEALQLEEITVSTGLGGLVAKFSAVAPAPHSDAEQPSLASSNTQE